MGQHARIVREELHRDESLCLSVGRAAGVDPNVVLARAIEHSCSLFVQRLVNDSDLTCRLVLDVGDARVEDDSVDVVRLGRSQGN